MRDLGLGKMHQRTVDGAQFVRLVLQHVLAKGFRRARCFGFLHPNAKRMAALLRLLVHATPPPPPSNHSAERAPMRCLCRGAPMRIVLRRVPPPPDGASQPVPPRPWHPHSTSPPESALRAGAHD